MVVFLALRELGFSPAVTVGGGFVATGLVYWYTRKDRLLGTISLIGFVVVSFSALLGIAWQNEKAYLAAGPISDFLMVSILIGSMAVRQPLVGSLACELFPGISGNLPRNARTFFGLSLLWAAFNLLQGTTRWYMLANMSPGDYTVWTKVLNYPVSAVLFVVTAWVIVRAAREVDSGIESTRRLLIEAIREG